MTFEKRIKNQDSLWVMSDARLVAAGTAMRDNTRPIRNLLQFSQASATVVLGVTTALLVTEVLPSSRGEEPCINEC